VAATFNAAGGQSEAFLGFHRGGPFKKDLAEKNCASSQVSREAGWQGVDVMITIFCDVWQFSAKKLTFFSKTNVGNDQNLCII
jgi:hypothetical protein